MANYRLVVTCPSDSSGGGGVLTVLGGKSSCRRKFSLAVALVDGAGQLVARDLVLHAAVVYAADHSPCLRGDKAAESPCFSTFNGIEFPASDKPTRMIAGRASFKLALSLLSSKCDNALFAIQISAQHAPGAEQLLSLPPAAYSGPIRSISRKRNRGAASGGTIPGFFPGSLLDALPSLSSPASSCDQEPGAPLDKRLKQEHSGEAQSAPQESSQALRHEVANNRSDGERASGCAAVESEQDACPPGLHAGGARPAHETTDVMDAADGPGTPPVTFAELAALLTQAGAFAPAASTAAEMQSDGNRPTPPAWGRGAAMEADGLASPMSPLALDTLNHATAMAAAHKMAMVMGRSFLASGHSSEAVGSSEQEQRSLDEEERTLQYMEASLAEVTMELLRRREDLSVRRRHRMEHEQQLKNMALNHPHLLWSCAPTNTD